MTVVCALVTVYLVVLIARAVMSWFPIRHGTPASAIFSIVYDLTEPVLAPLRRVIPPAGMLDLSFLVLTFFIVIVRTSVCS